MVAGPSIAERLARDLPLLSVPGHLISLLWGVITMGLCQASSLLKIAVEPVQRLIANNPVSDNDPDIGSEDCMRDALTPAGLCCLLWCFAAQGLRHRPLYTAIADKLAVLCHKIKWDDLADALWACATVDLSHPKFLEAAAERIVSEHGKVPGITFADAVRIAWAFTGALDRLTLQKDAVRLLLPPEILTGMLGSPGSVNMLPPIVWPLLQQVLAMQDCLHDKPNEQSQWLPLCVQLAAKHNKGRAGARLRAEVCEVLRENCSGQEVEMSFSAGILSSMLMQRCCHSGSRLTPSAGH